jgi:signal peptidase I
MICSSGFPDEHLGMSNKAMIGKISEWAVYAFLVFVFFVVLSPRLPTNKFFSAYVVPTGSMSPTVVPGSVAFVSTNVDPLVGDVVAFINPFDSNQTILHRIVSEGEAGFTTKGDNNNANDLWTLQRENIKGELLFSVPFLGHIAAAVRTPIGFGILVLLPGLFLAIQSVFEIYSGFAQLKSKVRQSVSTISVITFVIGFLLSSGANQAYAYFSDMVEVNGVSFITATLTPTPTPSPTSTPTPTITPSPSVTPSPSPTISPSPSPSPTSSPNTGLCPIDIEITGNGAGSQNEVEVECEVNTIIVQVNNLTSVSSVNINYTYQTLGITQMVLDGIKPDGQFKFTSKLFEGTCSADGCVPHKDVSSRKIKLKITPSLTNL